MKRGLLRSRNAVLGSQFGPISAGLLLILVLLVSVRVFLPGLFITLATPLLRVGTLATGEVHVITSSFGNTARLTQERDTAIQQIATLQNQNNVLASEVDDLTKLLGSRATAQPGILAGVLARPPVAPYDTLIVDVGSSDGVIPNAHVYGNGGIPTGYVDSVTMHQSRISLYSSPGESTPALIGATHIPVVLMGAGAGAFDATISRDSGAAVGDSIFIPGPGSLPVGTIIRIDSDPASPIETLSIRPIINPFQLSWVTISKDVITL